jgi:hypothetical protein
VALDSLLQNHPFGPQEIEFMAKAYEDACRASGLVDAKDPRAEIIARKIIEGAQQGERDPTRLRDQALAALSTHAVRQPPETSLDA